MKIKLEYYKILAILVLYFLKTIILIFTVPALLIISAYNGFNIEILQQNTIFKVLLILDFILFMISFAFKNYYRYYIFTSITDLVFIENLYHYKKQQLNSEELFNIYNTKIQHIKTKESFKYILDYHILYSNLNTELKELLIDTKNKIERN